MSAVLDEFGAADLLRTDDDIVSNVACEALTSGSGNRVLLRLRMRCTYT